MAQLFLYPDTNSNPRPIPRVWCGAANFHRADPSLWEQAGFVPYVNNPPAYDPETEILVRTGIVNGVQQYDVLPKPPPPVPESVTPLKFYTALFQVMGISETQVQGMIEAMDEGPQRELALTTFRRAFSVRRDNPLVLQLKDAQGVTDEQLDQLFLYADNLEV